MYTLVFAPQAIEDLSKLKKTEPAAFKKAGNFRNTQRSELESQSPSPETEWANGPGVFPRSIDLVYEIEETVVKVDVLSAYGHYEDK